MSNITRVNNWLQSADARAIATLASRYLDICTTYTGRATHYNTKEAQQEAAEAIHEELFRTSRGFYGLLACMNGTLDLAKQQAVVRLLDHPRYSDGGDLLTAQQEKVMLEHLVQALPAHRMFKLFCQIAERRINNRRTRNLILKAIFSQPMGALERWALSYRSKFLKVLKHCLGVKGAGALKNGANQYLSGSTMPTSARSILSRMLPDVWHAIPLVKQYIEVVGFVLGVKAAYSMESFVAFNSVKNGNWNEGSKLTEEVLEGLRSTYYKDSKTHADVLAATKSKMTAKKASMVQRKAQEAGIEVSFDAKNLNPIELYVMAYETGMTPDIQEALEAKAKKNAREIPVSLGKIGIVVDNSSSMFGHGTQKHRPIAAALATRDMLQQACREHVTVLTNKRPGRPPAVPAIHGDTSIASALLEVLEQDVEKVFLLTDGYENSPAGRVAEVMSLLRNKLKNNTPVFQLTNVSGAEAAGIRELAPGFITAMPIANPESFTISLMRGMLAMQDPKEGVKALIDIGFRGCFNESIFKVDLLEKVS